MKNIIVVMCLSIASLAAFAARTTNNTPLIGTWKFSKKTVINDYEQIFKNIQLYQSEHFTFTPDNLFRHEFINKEGTTVRILTGRWKSKRDKIYLKYKDVSFNIALEYHFTNKDLVFGNHLNHVILTKHLL